jgi:predicted  nucleic acid-binding Zn-ribbon protein
VVKRHQQIAEIVQKRAVAEAQVQAINEDQARIRQNMAVLDHQAEQYKDYVKEFGEQEKQLKELRERIQSLRDEENGARKSLDDYVIGLELS